MDLLFNPIIVSVILLCVLCLCRVNVLLALLVSAIVAGKIAGMHAGQIMDVFIGGMGQNSETALSYILLGTFAAAMAHTGLADVLAKRISLLIIHIDFNSYLACLCFSKLDTSTYCIYSCNYSAINLCNEQIKIG